ncbi:MAG TPA: transglutaminase-like domain-containing protein [Nocardioides sp.]|uniref:transglutaminase-like domain-containing protein n=1 Tax=Nocardioides sp. TaxID=35761 RepID=UPI002F40317A
MGEPIEQLRARAVDLARVERWADVLRLRPQLERDTEYWTSVWGPVCAVAAYHEGRDDARELLVSVIDAGFHDLNPVADLFAGSFATEPDWPELRARMEANEPPPPIEITEWPCAAPIGPLGLDRLDPDGEAVLASRMPPPAETARATASATLAWVTGRWRHSSTNHVAARDANAVLDLVQAGGRFACREYTIVLTQALNAIGIPARPVDLFREDYHAGMGTAHAVTEAWLDDLGRWVVLDGQNGATWRDSADNLLGVVELQQMLMRGDRPGFVGSGPNFEPETAEEWMAYFRHCSAGGAAWRPDSFVPVLEGRAVVEARPLLKEAASAHPDLAAISTSIVDQDGVPSALFGTDHPFATGFSAIDDTGVNRGLALDEPLPLDGDPGPHGWQVATRTRYGILRPSRLAYTIRQG